MRQQQREIGENWNQNGQFAILQLILGLELLLYNYNFETATSDLERWSFVILYLKKEQTADKPHPRIFWCEKINMESPKPFRNTTSYMTHKTNGRSNNQMFAHNKGIALKELI